MGVAKPYIRPGLRMLPAGSYLILYQEVNKGVEIVRVIHGEHANRKIYCRQACISSGGHYAWPMDNPDG
jgi:hypothetical protein